MEQAQNQQIQKKRNKLRKFKNELNKSNELMSELDMINKKLDETKGCLARLMVINQNMEKEAKDQSSQIEGLQHKIKASDDSLLKEIEDLKKQNEDLRRFTKEFQLFLKKEKRLTKEKILENTTIKFNFSSLVNEVVNEYNSLTKATNEQRAIEGKFDHTQDSKNGIPSQGMKISHSLFDLYDNVKSTPLQKLIKDSKRKNTDPNSKSKKRQRKQQ